MTAEKLAMDEAMDELRDRACALASSRRSTSTDAQCAMVLAIVYLADVIRAHTDRPGRNR